MATWPATLPQSPLIPVQVSADDSVLRSNMDAGPPSRRNRFTATTTALSYKLMLTGAQVSILDAFFHTTLRNGALSFDWKDPRTDATVAMAFIAPPKYTAVLGSTTPGERRWLASLSLEIQP